MVFSSSVLQDPRVLKTFFDPLPSIEKICRKEQGNYQISLARAIWIDFKAPLEQVGSILLRIATAVSRLFQLYELGNLCLVIAHQLNRDQHFVALWYTFGPQMVVPSLNRHTLDSYDCYMHSPIPIEKISHSLIRKYLFPEQFRAQGVVSYPLSTHQLNFFHREGLCRGGVNWFAYLFLKSKTHFRTPQQHLQAVARLFINGMPRQAAVLQTFCGLEEEVLKLKKEEKLTIPNEEWTRNPDAIVEKCRSLENGLYQVLVHRHVVIFLKTEKNGVFMWDPSCGLFVGQNDPQQTLLMSSLKRLHDPNQAEFPVSFHSCSLDFLLN